MHHESLAPVPNIVVTFKDLNDSGSGSLRDIFERKNLSNVIIRPMDDLVGTIVLSSPLKGTNFNNVVIDMDKRIDITGWDVELSSGKNITMMNTAIRTGDIQIRKKYKGKRPTGSIGLDCLNIDRCENVLITQCSLWSSCDEIVSVTRSRNVHLEYCFMVFPLGGDPLTHPYGKYHAECANCSANEICCFYRCVFGYYRMRGPQFEPNDAEKNQLIQMQACNNVMYAFKEAGSRYRSGPEKKSDKVKGTTYQFQYINNLSRVLLLNIIM